MMRETGMTVNPTLPLGPGLLQGTCANKVVHRRVSHKVISVTPMESFCHDVLSGTYESDKAGSAPHVDR